MKKNLRIMGTILVYCLTLVGLWATSKIDTPDGYSFVLELLPAAFMGGFYPILMAGLIMIIWESDPASPIVEMAMMKYLKIFYTLVVIAMTGGAFSMLFHSFSHNWPTCFELFAFPQAFILIVAGGLIMFIWRKEIFSSAGNKHSSAISNSETD